MRHWIHWLVGLALALFQLAGCQKTVRFNPALAGHFFPLRNGSSWTYQVTYPNGSHETITDRVLNTNQTGMRSTEALVVSDYSGHGTRAVRADLPQTYPGERTEVETRYLIEGGYISRVASLGGPTRIRLEEHDFLPQFLWPDRRWSNTLSPFEHSPADILQIAQNHRSFLEADLVDVPGGRFAECMRIETDASYRSPAGLADKRYFIDWYAPDVGLVKTLVLSGGQDGREVARIELVRFAKSKATAPIQPSNSSSIVPLSSKIITPTAPAGALTDK